MSHETWQTISVLVTGVSNAALWGVVLTVLAGKRPL